MVMMIDDDHNNRKYKGCRVPSAEDDSMGESRHQGSERGNSLCRHQMVIKMMIKVIMDWDGNSQNVMCWDCNEMMGTMMTMTPMMMIL